MNALLAIAKYTVTETIRDKILYTILGFSLIFILSSLFYGQIALNDVVIIKSFGLAGIYIFGSIITIFLSSQIIYKEIERRTPYFILSKPVKRSDIILGKFIGLLIAISLTLILMTVVYLGVIWIQSSTFDIQALLVVFFQILESALFIAILVFLSSFLSPLPSILSATMLLFIGHLLPTALENSKTIGNIQSKIALVVYYLLPNLEKFNLRNLVVHNLPIPPIIILLTILYAIFYISFLLILSIYIFQKREL